MSAIVLWWWDIVVAIAFATGLWLFRAICLSTGIWLTNVTKIIHIIRKEMLSAIDMHVTASMLLQCTLGILKVLDVPRTCQVILSVAIAC